MINDLSIKNIFLSRFAVFLIIFANAFFHAHTGHCVNNNATVRYAVSIEGAVYRSFNDSGWDEISSGLPDEIEFIRIYSHTADLKHAYIATGSQGLFRFDSSANKWSGISSPQFKTRTMYSRPQAYRKISAFAIDSAAPSHIVCATKQDLYESFDRGESWRPISRSGLNSRNYITSIAVKGARILVGTSFAGIFISHGGSFTALNAGLPSEPYSATMRFYDEATSLCIDPEKETYYAGFATGRGLFSCSNGNSWKEEFRLDSKNRFKEVDSVSVHDSDVTASVGGALYQKNKGKWITAEPGPNDLPFGKSFLRGTLYIENGFRNICYYKNNILSDKEPSRAEARGRQAIYASIPSIRTRLESLIKTIKECRLNAIVIDMKDDFGCVYFPTNNATAIEIGSAKKPVNVAEMLAKLKKNGIYSIARLVIFKDRELYKAYNGKYAIKDRSTGLPWKGTKNEFWVDPHSSFVHTYNVDLAAELADLGFDEIQFDYIRFPSDGPIERCVFPFCKYSDSYKSEVLLDFLYTARKNLSTPISTDIYGFNSWYRFGNTTGQDMEEFARYADVICPMVYPSHFGSRFYGKFEGDEKSYLLIYDGGIRARLLADNTIIRPYLQAFRLMSPNWGTGYILSQKRGAFDSGCSGFTYWNASGKYDILNESFAEK